jgi:4-hydroxymandelate oxidase
MRPTRRGVLAGAAIGAAAPGAQAQVQTPAQGPDQPLRFASPEALEAAARAALPAPVFDWIAGGAGEELTQRRNHTAFAEAIVTPRMLTGAGPPELGLALFGRRLRHPVLVAPMGVQGIAHPRGELASAAGAAAAGALFMAAMVATHSLDAIAAAMEAAAPGAPRWFQLYIPRDRGILLDLARRAEAAGYGALVLTVDAPVGAFRERDLAHGFTTPAALGAGNDRPDYPHPLMGGTDAGLTWADVEWLRARTALPLVLKGILSAQDAAAALRAGAGGIIVSSHGGRQFDGAPASLTVLPRIAAMVERRVPVLLDSGPRRGLDVLKALAAGADAVAIGRPVWWGLTLGGAQGVQSVLERLVAELTSAMRLAGCGSLAELTPDLLGAG